VSAESCGISAWTKTAKVSAIGFSGNHQDYFLKVISNFPWPLNVLLAYQINNETVIVF
jgi:hypothetical protein